VASPEHDETYAERPVAGARERRGVIGERIERAGARSRRRARHQASPGPPRGLGAPAPEPVQPGPGGGSPQARDEIVCCHRIANPLCSKAITLIPPHCGISATTVA
jgi:hypothetical protein